ncbi:MAG: phytanoyl-CoA dioxygenase family protein [Brevundimonas sp.]|nr:phytanoyl-CoA dioxygenase family protein [Brevundimonas sp.]
MTDRPSDVKSILAGVPYVESPLFESILPHLELSDYEVTIARQLYDRGFAVIDFPDCDFDERAERIKIDLTPRFSVDLADPASIKATGDQRLQDAWEYQDDVRALACNEAILELLTKLYGRRAIPFQTLNFPVGTQQTMHSDAAHFSSIPERFMCGVWVALEDISPHAGPLVYCPGSHAWPIITNGMIGRSGWRTQLHSAQAPFEKAWQAQIDVHGAATETFAARKGQALIWAANLLHGGSRQEDPTITRWSQVTHYYFDDCIYYTPAFSDEALGRLDLRTITDLSTQKVLASQFQGASLDRRDTRSGVSSSHWWRRLTRLLHADTGVDGWDPSTYLALNPDVAAAGEDPLEHFKKHGRAEGRRWQI